MTQGRQEQYWDGALYVFQADIVNNGANSGNHIYAVTSGVGSEMELLYGNVFNGDGSNRTITGVIQDDGGEDLGFPIPSGHTLNAGNNYSFPATDAPAATHTAFSAGVRPIFGGGMLLRVQVSSIAVSQDTEFALVLRIRGAIPTVTMTSPTGATETINTNKVM